jgi:RNA polymerase sigma factor (TIGR02999 family)
MMGSSTSEVTVLLNAVRSGDRKAIDRLFPLVYDELRQRAKMQAGGIRPTDTMNTTAIVHEAYLKLADQTNPDWKNRAHFYAVAAIAMRHVFLDYAKRKKRLKRGAGVVHVRIEDEPVAAVEPDMDDAQAEQILELDAALIKLGDSNPRLARVVECRFFGGMTVEDTAEVLGTSAATVKRDWVLARAKLFKDITGLD